MEQLQNHTCGRASYFLIYEEMRKYFPIYSMRRPLVIYDFATAPFGIFLYMRKIFFFISVSFKYFEQLSAGPPPLFTSGKCSHIFNDDIIYFNFERWTVSYSQDSFLLTELCSLAPAHPSSRQTATIQQIQI